MKNILQLLLVALLLVGTYHGVNAAIETWSTTAASNNAAPPDGAPENMAPSALNNVIRENMAQVRRWAEQAVIHNWGPEQGSADNYSITPQIAVSSLVTGARFTFLATATNTGASNLAVSGLSAVTIVKLSDTALEAGDITGGLIYDVVYDGTYFQLIGKQGNETDITVTALSALTAMGINEITGTDSLRVYDDSEGADNRITLSNFDTRILDYVTIDTVDRTADLVPVYDDSAGAMRKVSAGNIGRLVQWVSFITTAHGGSTSVIGNDDSIPQSSEGVQVLTVNITPTKVGNKLLIEAYLHVSNNAAGHVVAALFRDSNTNASAVAADGVTSNPTDDIYLRYVTTADVTSQITFDVNIGASSGTTTINGTSAGRRYGGALESRIDVQEIVP